MCGIAGVLAPDGRAASLMPAVDAMRRAMAHRGPDDCGTWCAGNGGAAFAHTRLSIIDLSPAGHQPMSSPCGRYTITFNGEIYNFLELRKALAARGATFSTGSDTEVILRAFELDGPSCVSHLRGMFAFALWDDKEQTCLLARDRFGIKPLYYHADTTRLVFASEVRALIASRLVPKSIDPDGLYAYFRTGSVPEPQTLLSGVRSLEAGHYALWNRGTWRSVRYWNLTFGTSHRTGVDAVTEVREALTDSVAHHFVSDRPVGIFLSGGVDSTALVALATIAGRRGLHTFSVAFPGFDQDEGLQARRTADHFGTTHAEWSIDTETGRQLIGDYLVASDQPSIDGLNTFSVSRFASRSGLKVVLSGLGGDELFAGYKSFDDVPRMARWNRGLELTGPLRPAAGASLEKWARDPRWRRVGDMLRQPATLLNTWSTFRGVFTRQEARRLVRHHAGVDPHDGPPATLDETVGDPTARDAVSRLEMTRYMRNQLLRDSDAMSMASGLELRVPFLDGPLVDRLTAIPSATRLQPGKRLLLQAVPEIPDWVAGQPKRGFTFPFTRWFSSEGLELVNDVDRRSPVPAQTWYRKWCVFVLEQWLQREGISPR